MITAKGGGQRRARRRRRTSQAAPRASKEPRAPRRARSCWCPRSSASAARGREQAPKPVRTTTPRKSLGRSRRPCRTLSTSTIIDCVIVPCRSPGPSTLLGSGKVEELKDAHRRTRDRPRRRRSQHHARSSSATSRQAWNAKVLDRTGLILEIFGERARTREGVLQVELAHLTYQKGRLVRAWTHLGAPARRRRLSRRPRRSADRARPPHAARAHRSRSSKRAEDVVKTRDLHRKGRRRVPYPIVAIVGYTNAGKSTLFNKHHRRRRRRHGPGVRHARPDDARSEAAERTAHHPVRHCRLHFRSADDARRRFPRHARRGRSKPTSFCTCATSPIDETDAQAQDVEGVLADLGIDTVTAAAPILEVWNKIDLLTS